MFLKKKGKTGEEERDGGARREEETLGVAAGLYRGAGRR